MSYIHKEQIQLLVENKTDELILSITPDWPSIIVTGIIGIGSILTSIAVSWISKQNQKSQSKSKTAELRQLWLTELRDSLSAFISNAFILNVRNKTSKEFDNSKDFQAIIAELIHLRIKIKIMLDPKKDYTQSITKRMMQLIDAAFNDDEGHKLTEHIKALEKIAQEVLEKAWNDIRRDLN